MLISRSKYVLSVSMLEISEQSHSWSSLSVLSTSSTRPGGRPVSCSLQLQLVQGRVSLRVDSSKSTLFSAEYDLDFAQRLPQREAPKVLEVECGLYDITSASAKPSAPMLLFTAYILMARRP